MSNQTVHSDTQLPKPNDKVMQSVQYDEFVLPPCCSEYHYSDIRSSDVVRPIGHHDRCNGATNQRQRRDAMRVLKNSTRFSYRMASKGSRFREALAKFSLSSVHKFSDELDIINGIVSKLDQEEKKCILGLLLPPLPTTDILGGRNALMKTNSGFSSYISKGGSGSDRDRDRGHSSGRDGATNSGKRTTSDRGEGSSSDRDGATNSGKRATSDRGEGGSSSGRGSGDGYISDQSTSTCPSTSGRSSTSSDSYSDVRSNTVVESSDDEELPLDTEVVRCMRDRLKKNKRAVKKDYIRFLTEYLNENQRAECVITKIHSTKYPTQANDPAVFADIHCNDLHSTGGAVSVDSVAMYSSSMFVAAEWTCSPEFVRDNQHSMFQYAVTPDEDFDDSRVSSSLTALLFRSNTPPLVATRMRAVMYDVIGEKYVTEEKITPDNLSSPQDVNEWLADNLPPCTTGITITVVYSS